MPARQRTSRPAPAGHASTQRRQPAHPPSVTGSAAASSASVNTVVRRTHGPSRGETKIAVLPIQPSPACVAAVLWAKTPAAVMSLSALVADRGLEGLGRRAVLAEERRQALRGDPQGGVDPLVLGEVGRGGTVLHRRR